MLSIFLGYAAVLIRKLDFWCSWESKSGSEVFKRHLADFEDVPILLQINGADIRDEGLVN